MNDTNSRITREYIGLMKKRSNEDRFLMGCSMYDFAKTIVMNSIISQNPEISGSRINEKIFLRFYGSDMGEAKKAFNLGNINKIL